MKKTFSFFMVLTLATGIILQSCLFNSDQTIKAKIISDEVIAGDLNADGKADATDFSMLSLFLLGDINLSETQQNIVDFDNDGIATLADLAKFRQFLAKTVTELIEFKSELSIQFNAMKIIEANQPESVAAVNLPIIMNYNVPCSIDDLEPRGYYRFQVTKSVDWLPQNYPYDGIERFIIKFTNTYNAGNYDTVIIYDRNMKPLYRKTIDNCTEYEWHDLNSTEDAQETSIIYVGQNERFTKITDALSYAYSTGDVKIVVRKGFYDITSEINLESAGSGPKIGNNTTLYCEQGTIISCEYNGTSESVKTNFSPFNAGNGDYILENVVVRCKNVRYCIHDELASISQPYVHKYINCDMWLDNSENLWDAPQCIGGGLGQKAYIVIDGGIYDSLPADLVGWSGVISYHNGLSSECESHIEVKNVYCGNSTVRLGYYGTSTKKNQSINQ